MFVEFGGIFEWQFVSEEVEGYVFCDKFSVEIIDIGGVLGIVDDIFVELGLSASLFHDKQVGL